MLLHSALLNKKGGLNMFNLGKFILFIIWLLDIFNLPFMQCLDNELPINTIAWIIIWILVFILDER